MTTETTTSSSSASILLNLIAAAATLGGIALVIASITAPEWILIALALMKAGPSIMSEFQKLHPIFSKLVDSINTTGNAESAVADFQNWLKTNSDYAIWLQNQKDKDY